MEFKVFKDSIKQYRWRLVSGNGQIVATSGEGYTTKENCLHGIQLIKTYAPTAKVIDLTLAG
jgi:uncharacterized protein YegP (UPF0339 family)